MANEWLRYTNQGATRRQPISPQLVQALGSYLPDMGIQMEVFSGGQAGKGSGGPRTGSIRHDHGNAADVFFYKDGRRLNWANASDLPYFQEIVKRGKAAGITGFGAGQGYMQPGSMHVGYGSPGVWGAGGKGGNAANWLREAYGMPSGRNTDPGIHTAPPGRMVNPDPGMSVFASAQGPTNLDPGISVMPSMNPSGLAAMFGNPAMGAGSSDVGGNAMMGVASMFLRQQAERQQQEKDRQEAEEIRRAALLGGDLSSLYG